MTAPRAFRPGELDGVDGLTPDDLAAETQVARDLEALAGVAAGSTAGMTPDFIDLVMAAVGAEPAPAPARAAGLALRRGAFGAFLASFADAWRVATRSGFPGVVRAQALALVIVVAAFAAGSGVLAAGAVGLIRGDPGLPPAPSFEAPSPLNEAPTPFMPSPAVETPSVEVPSETDEDTANEPVRTAKPTSTDDHDRGGRGSSGTGGGGGDGGGQRTPKPTDAASGSGGGEEDDEEDGSDDHSGPGGGGDGESDDSRTSSGEEASED